MVFESVRGYLEIASGLTELTRARAMEAARGLLSLPAAGVATGSKVAIQVGALADELMAAAAANRSNLAELVQSEVDVAVTRLGLVSAHKLEQAQAEAAMLRVEVGLLRGAAAYPDDVDGWAPTPAAPTAPVKEPAAPRGIGTKKAATRRAAKKAAPRTAVRKSAVTTRAKPAGA